MNRQTKRKAYQKKSLFQWVSIGVGVVIVILLLLLIYVSQKSKQQKEISVQQTTVNALTQSEISTSLTEVSAVDTTLENQSSHVLEVTTTSLEDKSQRQEASGLTFVRGILIVNKAHGLPETYNPDEDPTAKQAFLNLKSDMQNLGFSISDSYSGFRSYSYQASLYQSYVTSHGQTQADRFSARPGYSEHQTGLAYDLLNGNGELLGTNDQDVQAVKWLAENAHRYGFIVRYLEGKEEITGYMAETWHIRYIGDMASTIYQSGLTLEEYLGVEGGQVYK